MGDFDPAQRLIELLGSTPNHPWQALIPQVVVWCFRRFCIEKIVSSGGSLVDSLWDDHLELVHRYCPKGLEAASTEWFTPENINTLYSSLDQYNDYFVKFIHKLDSAISNEDYEMQDLLSGFLDSEICSIFKGWLGDSPFIIFPMSSEEEDEFTDAQFRELIRALMEQARHTQPVEEVAETFEEVVAPVEEVVAPFEEVVAPVEEVVARVDPSYIPQPSLLWHFVSPPPPPLMPDSLYPYTPKSTVYEQNIPLLPLLPPSQPPPSQSLPKFIILPHKESQPPAQQQTPIIRSVAKAIAYRRTKRQRRHHNTRGKTRRSQPAA